ncbi:MAG TPA: PQQ-dependent sugar dehydrogenase [Bryobacteraceae bacterium]|nr:PQQ-dependent sugar dehydrogenase [Bryobacteraceae bacterium]
MSAQDSEIRLTPVITGVSAPTDLQNAADGTNRLFAVQQNGLIRIFKNGSLVSQPFLDIRTRTRGTGERGLLGLAFPPGYASTGRFYVNYTDLAGDTVIAMYRAGANPDAADGSNETVLLTVKQPFANHNGGALRFGPDGYLYIGMGDGGSGGDPQNNAQNPQSLLGKMLRIDVESQPGQVLVPTGNPFAGTGTTRAEIWALGLRNPWRFSFDRATGDMWIADVGQNAWEEVDFQPASSRGGENYGWRTMEGAHCYNASNCNMQGLVLPVAEYRNPADGCSITGGYVYRGASFPGLRGTYIYGDLCSGRIWGLRREGNSWVNRQLLTSGLSITTFGEDEAGEVYVADAARGVIHRIEGSAAVEVTIASTPAGQKFIIDQDASGHIAPETFRFAAGSSHTITWSNSQDGATRWSFNGWSDGSSGNPRTIAVGSAGATYTANYAAEYALTRNSQAGGTVTVTPSPDGYYLAGSTVQVNATANPGYRFGGFSGCVSSTSATASFSMTAPCTLTSSFVPLGIQTPGLLFVPVVPCRVMDTRDANRTGSLGPPLLTSMGRRDVAVTQSGCSIPPAAKAYSLNVTVVPRNTLSYLTMWPAGQPQPFVSTLNAFDGRVVANAAIVPAGAGGNISLFATEATGVILDVNGYFSDSAGVSGLTFHPITPCRAVDTREESGQPILSAGSRRDFPLTRGSCASMENAAAYSLAAAVVPDGPLAFLTLWPGGQAQPLVSTLNSFDGAIVSNAAIVPASVDATIGAFAAGRTHLILDANGFFAQPTLVPGGLKFYPTNPCRVVDTRSGSPIPGGGRRDISVPQSNCGVASTAQAYALNVTAIPAGSLGYLTMWPAGQAQPLVSTLNSAQGRISAAAALVQAGANGAVSVFVTDTAHVVLDINGYFAP